MSAILILLAGLAWFTFLVVTFVHDARERRADEERIDRALGDWCAPHPGTLDRARETPLPADVSDEGDRGS